MKPFKPANIIIVGPSGGGKGTQAKLLAQEFGWKHISTGEVFRKEVKKGTKYGKKVNQYMLAGKWVPTKLVFEGLIPVFEKLDYQGFILDGFPRARNQPRDLDKLLAKKKKKIDLVIHLKIRPEVIMARRKKAWAKGKSFYQDQRKDETLRAIRARIKSYRETIKPILKYYQKKGILVNLDGERKIRAICQDIVSLVKKELLKNE